MIHYRHDCTKCLSLGDHQYKNDWYDLYYCPSEYFSGQTLIARFSSKGPDYISGTVFGFRRWKKDPNDQHPMAEAYRRALVRGLDLGIYYPRPKGFADNKNWFYARIDELCKAYDARDADQFIGITSVMEGKLRDIFDEPGAD